MTAPLDELYLQWLYEQVATLRRRSTKNTYWSLMRKLYTTEFLWLVPNDDNRVEDGRDLRYEFIAIENLERDEEWLGLGCSMLEMLIGVARRLAFEADGEPRGWFWLLLANLDLDGHNDAVIHMDAVEEILERVIRRTYLPDGRGGLFPLRHPHEDQRNVEIWYQLSAYLLERE